jgi:hypothetical protein
MTTTQQGRFCESCKKEVIDFTALSDQQILKRMNSSANICGRVEAGQLERNLVRNGHSNVIFRHAWKFLVPTFFFSKGVTGQMLTGKVARVDTNRITPHPSKDTVLISMVGGLRRITTEKYYTIAGAITDSVTQEIVLNARIIINGKGVNTDKEGRYLLRSKTTASIINIGIAATGYITKQIPVSVPVTGFHMQIDAHLAPVVKVLKEVVITSEPKPHKMGELSYVTSTVQKDSSIKKGSLVNNRHDPVNATILPKDSLITPSSIKKNSLISIIQEIFTPNYLKVFPNPVERGSSVNISARINKNGIYYIQLYDINGKIMSTTQLNVTSTTFVSAIPCKPSLTPGSYFIAICDAANKIILTSRVIIL